GYCFSLAGFTNHSTIGNVFGWPSRLYLAGETLAPDSMFDFVINTNWGFVSLGTSDLNGRLRVALRGGFVPNPTDSFYIVQFRSAVSNSFLNAADGMRLKTVDNLGSFLVSYI